MFIFLPFPIQLHYISILPLCYLLLIAYLFLLYPIFRYLHLPYLSLNTPLILIFSTFTYYINSYLLYSSSFTVLISTIYLYLPYPILNHSSHLYLPTFSLLILPTLLTFSYYFLPPLYLSSFILDIFISPIHHLLYSFYILFSYPLPLFIHLYSFIHTHKISHFPYSSFGSIPVMPYTLSFWIFSISSTFSFSLSISIFRVYLHPLY